ncbi:MAG: Fe-S oxidoreductase [Halothiobacillus sp. 24-54-40]|jgi:hypothetical protein|nr:DUF1987 domain-containing protein [Halothiobacillaceae bacterium]OYV47594.1 MAG: Fe-S oxidoreductase [Halothiobacillus sp. 20-53-49]OYY36737.1 MAG: Fe-S oxidoreductase [Halothiobacillus sp. 35-54-62]OYZ85755.1 MAG: Fe-S oxidoreductase [Halothiobacillus sp. 24-54-40]OZA79423.1 MAG: Fe-S oxidoreductase [Halothiobacillus sp. 39-53-45]HQS02689.1 DUF1987 domain-containing protein [Halothiobacillus sp.]
MEKFYLAATSNTPEVDFDFPARRLLLKGESYPESAAAFYGDILNKTSAFLDETREQTIHISVQLNYFNSSSTKMLFSLFDRLNLAAEEGNTVVLDWHHDIDDETILEFGLELAEDFPAIEFHAHAIES